MHWKDRVYNHRLYNAFVGRFLTGLSEHEDIEQIKTAMVIMASVLVIVVVAMAFVFWCFVKTHRKMNTSNTVKGDYIYQRNL